MSDVENELDKKEDEELELEDQEQEDLQDDAHQDEDEQDDEQDADVDEDADSDDSDQDEEEERKPSRRESLRIQALLEKMKEEEPSQKASKAKKDETVFDDDKVDFQQNLEAVYRFSRFETRLEVDAPRVEQKYPQLDKESDDFNPALASTINRMYLSFVGFDGDSRQVRTADIRYSDYVDSVYELASEIAGATIERTTTNIKKQASKTGVRPGGGSAKRLNLNKAPSDMTDEELDAMISASLPKKR